MKKVLCLLLVIVLLTGCGKVPKLSNGKDIVVSFGKEKPISVDDLYEKMKNTYALSTLITMVDVKIFERAFPKYIDEAKKLAEAEVEKLKESYPDEDKLIQALYYYTRMASVEEYKESVYLNYLQNHAANEYAKENVTDKQIEQYYKNNVSEDIDVKHILIVPKVTDKMSKEEKTKAEDKALNDAKDLLKEIKDEKKDILATFEKLAKEKSQDDATKSKGGSLGKINKNSLGTKYQKLTDEVFKLKDNSLYDGVVKTEIGYHIVYRGKSYEKPALKDVKESIIATLGKEALEKDQALHTKALQYYRKKSKMKIEDSVLAKQYSNYISNTILNATTEKTD